MSKSSEPRSASEFGSHEPFKLRDHLEERYILNTFEIIRLDKDGNEPQYGPYAILQLTHAGTGQIQQVLAGNTYVMSFLEAVGTPENCPIKVMFVKVGKAFGVRGW